MNNGLAVRFFPEDLAVDRGGGICEEFREVVVGSSSGISIASIPLAHSVKVHSRTKIIDIPLKVVPGVGCRVGENCLGFAGLRLTAAPANN